VRSIEISPRHDIDSDPIDWFSSPAPFDGALREMLHALKFGGKDYVVPLLVDLLLKNESVMPGDIEAIIPVPTSFWREIRRGYNQSALLAEEIGRRWQIPVCKELLRRVSFTRSQVDLSKAKRWQNARMAFKRKDVKKGNPSFFPKSVLLIDDICTTGATLNACASVLKRIGVTRIFAATVAWERLSH
jgi:competence protein ComFC